MKEPVDPKEPQPGNGVRQQWPSCPLPPQSVLCLALPPCPTLSLALPCMNAFVWVFLWVCMWESVQEGPLQNQSTTLFNAHHHHLFHIHYHYNCTLAPPLPPPLPTGFINDTPLLILREVNCCRHIGVYCTFLLHISAFRWTMAETDSFSWHHWATMKQYLEKKFKKDFCTRLTTTRTNNSGGIRKKKGGGRYTQLCMALYVCYVCMLETMYRISSHSHIQ